MAVVVLQPANFRDGDNVVWRLLWAAWRGCGRRMRSPLWMPYKRPPGQRAPWVHTIPTTGSWPSGGYTLVAKLETEACKYLFQLWGLWYSRGFLRGAVPALRELEEMVWLLVFIRGRVWRCTNCATSQTMACPYAALEELRAFAMVWDGRA